ncbi:MAG: argininosuccinate lyase [Bdellovibrionia bacterium]
MSKLWGGRFEKETHHLVEEFTHSLAIDARLWECDLAGSKAHARMLGKVGVLSADESAQIVAGLEWVHEKIANSGLLGSKLFNPAGEDIHSELERLLTEKIGPLAGKLHTARSRNDQVATTTRLYLRQEIKSLEKELQSLETWILEFAERNLDTMMPGFTHMQHAQPISLAQHFMAYFAMFRRDSERLQDCSKRVNVMPLGSAALAGTSFPIDREMTAAELGFAEVSSNSLDAVSDRDFVVEFLSAASLIMTHLSRLSEELILWSTPEFGFVELDDSVTTGSSIMPQKKNPDVAELIRGKVGRVNGALVGALTLLKALPLSYNRDLQEDKTFLFEGIDTTRSSLRLMQLMLEGARFRQERMESALKGDFSNATDLADYLVRRGLTFRQSHEIVGRVVRDCIEQSIGLEDMTLEGLQRYSPLIQADVVAILKHRDVMQARISQGGTSPSSVKAQIAEARRNTFIF